jgi:GntR family transcriptional regulator
MSWVRRVETRSRQAERFTPLYFRIEETFRERILSGELGPGAQLPSETELARDYATTRVTVRQAMTRLLYDGLIIRQRGRGSFVAPKSSVVTEINTHERQSFEQQVAARGQVVTYADVRFRRVKAPALVSLQLSLPKGADVYQLDRLRVVNDQTVGSEIRYFPIALGRKVTQRMLEEDSALNFLLAVYARKIPVIEVTMTAVTANKTMAERLGIKPGAAIMVRDNVFRDEGGNIVQCGTSYFRGDVQIQYVLGSLASSK